MALNVFDRVCETATTVGLSSFATAGALPGYRTFNSVASDGYAFYYLIEAVDASGVATGEWEVGIGYMFTATELVRQVVLESSTGAKVNFAAGTKHVHLTAPAYQLKTKVYRAGRSTDLTAQNFTTATAIPWNLADYSSVGSGSGLVGSFHSIVSNTSRITMPTGFDLVRCRFHGQVTLANITASEWVELKFRLGGSTIVGRSTHSSPSTTPTYQFTSPIAEYAVSDYMEMLIQVQTDTSVDIIASGSFFQLEILQ